MGYMRSSCGEWAVLMSHLTNLGTTQHDNGYLLQQSWGSMPRGTMSIGSGSSSVIASTSEISDGEK